LLTHLEEALLNHIGRENLKAWFNNKSVTFRFGGPAQLAKGGYSGLTERLRVTFFANGTTSPVINILHEFGHLFDNVWDDFFTNALQKETFRRGGTFFGGWDGGKYRSLPGDRIRAEVLKSARIAGGDAWQQRGGTPHFEDWADIFSNAMLGNINEQDEIGRQLLTFVARMEAHVQVPAPSGGGGPGTTGGGTGTGAIPPAPDAFDTKALPAITPALAVKIGWPVLNVRNNMNVSGNSPSGSVVGLLAQNTTHQVFEVVRVNDRIWARVGTNQWIVVEKRDGTVYSEFVQTGGTSTGSTSTGSTSTGGGTGTGTTTPPASGDPFDRIVLPAITPTLAIKVTAGGLNLRKTTETRNGLPSGPTNGSLSKNAVQKVLEVVRIEDRIWARVGTEQWAVVEKRDGTKYAAFTNT
jgi:hypothetical protein